MTEPIRIALLVLPAFAYYRGVLRGISHFARGADGWTCTIQTDAAGAAPLLEEWKPAGVIAAFEHPGLARAVLGLGVPVVSISNSGAEPDSGISPRVGPDESRIGHLAAEHFIGRGFRHFGYCGVAGRAFSDERGRGFAQALRGHFKEAPHLHDFLHAHPGRPSGAAGPGATSGATSGAHCRLSAEAMRAWVQSLPKPVAVFAATDARAYELAEACHQAAVRIPDELALLGVDDDDLFCSLVSPPLSSVIVPAEQIGYQAARLLDRMLAGKAAPSKPLLLPPPGISTRRSSDVYAVNDPNLTAATHFIRSHAHEPIGVEDILKHVPVSRSTMEHRFKNLLGRTMLEEIRRVRVERARELLGNTDLRIAAVATRTGFGNQARFSVVFRRETGQTPGEYRKQFRLHDDARSRPRAPKPRRSSEPEVVGEGKSSEGRERE